MIKKHKLLLSVSIMVILLCSICLKWGHDTKTSCIPSLGRSERTGADSSTMQPVLESHKTKTTPETLQAFETAVDVLTAIKDRNYQLLAEYAHPEKGIIFSPDPNVNYSEDTVFKADQIKAFDADTVYEWGYYSASNSLLKLTPSDYFTYYVYNEDFLNCDQIGINSIVWSGNAPENVEEAFPAGTYVDFHYKGTEEFAYIDWSSVKIVMEKYNEMMKVVAVIHSAYTL